MKRVQAVVVFLVGCVAVWAAQPAHAQLRVPIDRPTFSPYLHLFRSDRGPLGQYHSWVRPRQELRRTLASQSTAIRSQQRGLQGLQGEVSRFGETGPTRATGSASTFMNYSHYYPSLGGTAPSTPRARSSSGGYTPARGSSGGYGGSSGGYGGY